GEREQDNQLEADGDAEADRGATV
ncbi:MAG: hypothetical protein UX82_C0001G0001, partial [Microgenomates group bacterium GW2011_GWE1_47_12]